MPSVRRSLIPLFTHSCVYAFMHSLIHTFTHLCVHSLIRSLIHTFAHSLGHSFIHSPPGKCQLWTAVCGALFWGADSRQNPDRESCLFQGSWSGCQGGRRTWPCPLSLRMSSLTQRENYSPLAKASQRWGAPEPLWGDMMGSGWQLISLILLGSGSWRGRHSGDEGVGRGGLGNHSRRASGVWSLTTEFSCLSGV